MNQQPQCTLCKWCIEKQKDYPGGIKGLWFLCAYNPPTHEGFPSVAPTDFCREWTSKQ